MAKNWRNPVHLADGRIDCEIAHPELGWIPFTASAGDPDPDGRALFEVITASGEAAPYDPANDPPAYPSAEHALAAMVKWAESFVAPLVSGVPAEEVLSWPAKEPAAEAYKAGTATPRQVAMIEGEAAVTGEDPFVLADLILQKAAPYGAVVAAIAGLRRKVTAQIAAESDPYQYEGILLAAKGEALQLAQDLGLAEALGVA